MSQLLSGKGAGWAGANDHNIKYFIHRLVHQNRVEGDDVMCLSLMKQWWSRLGLVVTYDFLLNIWICHRSKPQWESKAPLYSLVLLHTRRSWFRRSVARRAIRLIVRSRRWPNLRAVLSDPELRRW